MCRPLRLAAVFLVSGLPFCRPARANPSLSNDFMSIMQWFSGQMVEPLAFNAGDTFPNPLLTRPGRGQLEMTLGGGLLPANNGNFPTLSVQTLNDLGIKNQFPAEVPFGDVTSTLRYGLPWRSDLAIRVSNITFPRMRIAPGMEAQAQSNTFGLQFRKFLHWGQDNALSLTGYYQYHPGAIHFYNKFSNIALTDGFSVSSDNTGSLIWHLQAAGVNLIFSRRCGDWTPYLGAGFNQSFGSLKGELQAAFDTSLISEVLGQASARPRQSSMRGLFGFNLAQGENWNYFVAGEFLANNDQIGQAVNVHVGVMFPISFGASGSEAAKPPLFLGDKNRVSDKKFKRRLAQDPLIFIQ